MRFIYHLALVFLCSININAQRLYRFNDHGKTTTKTFDLIDTELNLSFDFKTQTVNGEAWLKLSPHFDATNKLQLDAKSMTVFKVKSNNKDLKFYNTGNKLNIDLPLVYQKKDTLNIYIQYKGNPNKIKNKGGVAITDNKGMYFINPLEKNINKPTQIWTQGEPEQNSVWFPTIDKPNQKSTQKITLTVPSKYKTLSNGLLINQQENTNGTRTDVWQQTLPHAPYLFFVGVGDFEIIKDTWQGKEVSYYVEPKYKDTALELFKNTKEMLTFFSELTGVNYPWDKYSQIIVRDYVSGAMENTGAVVHSEQAMQSKGELSERNEWETVIAHEMFHHWFGDLVTAESWANITVNESFANYSEYLWLEHKYGSLRAQEHLLSTRNAYLNKKTVAQNYNKHLVRYNYGQEDEVFDVISYHKGGLILHMLRDYLGDDKFFAGFKEFLEKNKFSTAEAQQLRLAMEKVSGEDLMWFFSQWYYSKGHPKLNVTHYKNEITKELIINVQQQEKEFDFPLSIDIYYPKSKQSVKVFVTEKQQEFKFPLEDKVVLVKVDANHSLLSEITVTNEVSDQELIVQYTRSKHYIDRINALKKLKLKQTKKQVFNTFFKAMNDEYDMIQAYAIENINLSGKYGKKKVIKKLELLSKNINPNIAGAAISTLGKLVDTGYTSIFEKGIQNISPKVKGNSLLALYYIDKKLAYSYANKLPSQIKDIISRPLLEIYIEEKNEKQISFVAKYLFRGVYASKEEKDKQKFKQAFEWVSATNNIEAIKALVNDFVKKGLLYKNYNYHIVAREDLRKVFAKQNLLKNKNKAKILAIIEAGMVKLSAP